MAESHCEDMEAASDEVSLKLSLWEGRVAFDELVTQWRLTHFESLDMALFEEAINKCATLAVLMLIVWCV